VGARLLPHFTADSCFTHLLAFISRSVSFRLASPPTGRARLRSQNDTIGFPALFGLEFPLDSHASLRMTGQGFAYFGCALKDKDERGNEGVSGKDTLSASGFRFFHFIQNDTIGFLSLFGGDFFRFSRISLLQPVAAPSTEGALSRS
jgi:hypothetical protein